MVFAPRSTSPAQPVIAALLAAEGTASHGYTATAAAGDRQAPLVRNTADLADALHHLCILHGHVPGVIDHAAARTTDNAARAWLIAAVDGFGAERALLARLTVEAGPQPSTTGQNETIALVTQQRHALDMLAQSDRRGCAMGAALALALDWRAIRTMLDLAALRLGIEPRATSLPEPAHTAEVADTIGTEPAVARALHFGAAQLLGQHRGLWDLLQARAELRKAAA